MALVFSDCRNFTIQKLLQSWSQQPTSNNSDTTIPEESSSTDAKPVMNVNTFHEDGTLEHRPLLVKRIENHNYAHAHT